jgi:hypothetical protein
VGGVGKSGKIQHGYLAQHSVGAQQSHLTAGVAANPCHHTVVRGTWPGRGRRVCGCGARQQSRVGQQDPTRCIRNLERHIRRLNRLGAVGLQQDRATRVTVPLGNVGEFVGHDLVEFAGVVQDAGEVADRSLEFVALGLEFDARELGQRRSGISRM